MCLGPLRALKKESSIAEERELEKTVEKVIQCLNIIHHAKRVGKPKAQTQS